MKKHNKKRKQIKRSFFWWKREDWKGDLGRSLKKILFFVAQRVWLQETWRYLKDPKRKFKEGERRWKKRENKRRQKREIRWKEDEQKEEIKRKRRHFEMEACCEGDREKSNKKRTTWKTDERKTRKEKGTDKPKNMKFFRQSFCFEKSEAKNARIFLRREKQEERENTKEHFSLLRTNQQETHFQKKNQYKRNQIKNNMVFSEKEYVTEEKTKGEKNDDQTEQSPQKKRYMKNGSNRGKTFKNENKKKHVQKQMRINQKGNIDQKKRRTNMQNINMKRCTTKKEIDKQVFWICGSSINLFFKGGHGQRKQKKERENTCDRNEKTRRKKETTDEQMYEQKRT